MQTHSLANTYNHVGVYDASPTTKTCTVREDMIHNSEEEKKKRVQF
jgi:hypothetical protein